MAAPVSPTGDTWTPNTVIAPVIKTPDPVQQTVPLTGNAFQLPTTPVVDTSGQSALAGIIGVCGTLLNSLFAPNSKSNVSDISDTSDELDRYNESLGNQRDTGWSDDDVAYMGRQGADLGANCANFIDKEGRVGPLGREIQTQIRNYPESYSNNDPPDVLRLCPGYSSMAKEERERFWVWTFAMLAKQESSCSPVAINRKCNRQDAARTGCKYNPNSPPNGDAIGLFQLWEPACPGKSTAALMNPYVNSRCAVHVLAGELEKRDTLTTNQTNTYWGPFRANTRHAGDARGNAGFVANLGAFRGCSK